jgi:2-enoate reductase
MNCVHRGVLRDTPITCAVNPAMGREAELRLVPAEQKRHVVVIGGGPAGLEAAEVAAARGHQVTLLSGGKELGGEFRLTGAAPQKGPVSSWIEFMRGRLAKLGVTVRLGTEATSKLVEEAKPDVVLVATGPLGGPVRSALAGEVKGRVVRLQDVLAGRAEAGARVVILGDDQMAVEAADLLSEKGKKVAVVGAGRKLAPAMLNIIRNVLLRKLADKQVELLTETRVGAIGASGVEVVGKDGQRRTLEASTVVLGNDYRVDAELVSAISAKVPAVHLVGGCRLAGDHQDAIHDGFHVARVI